MLDPRPASVHVARRLQNLEGEATLNLLRLLAVAVFFTVHVVNRASGGLGAGTPITLANGLVVPVFDTVATAIALAWTGAAGGVLLALRLPRPPRVLPTLMSLVDIGLLSVLVFIGNGPTSPLVHVFSPLIAATSLRGRRVDVWLVTFGSLVVYGASVALAAQLSPANLPPSHHVLFVAAALGITGLVVDLLVANTWSLAERHADVVDRVRRIDPEQLSHDRPWDCPWCATHNRPLARRCTRCDQPLVASEPVHEGVLRGSRSGVARLAWTAGVALVAFIALVVLVSLAMTWPALTVPYAGLAGVLVLGLGRLVHLDLWGDHADGSMGQAASTVGTVVGAVAFSATLLVVLIAVAVLMVAAGAVIAVALCFAVLVSLEATS